MVVNVNQTAGANTSENKPTEGSFAAKVQEAQQAKEANATPAPDLTPIASSDFAGGISAVAEKAKAEQAEATTPTPAPQSNSNDFLQSLHQDVEPAAAPMATPAPAPASGGLDMNSIINEQVAYKQAEDKKKTATQTPTSTETAQLDTATEKQQALEKTTEGLQDSLVPGSEIEQQSEASKTFDLNSIISDQAKPENMSDNDLDKAIKEAEKKPIARGGLLRKIGGIGLIGAGAFGLYFAASVFYPIEVQQAKDSVGSIVTNLRASILGGAEETSTTDTIEPTADETPQEIDDQISTPIADSVTQPDRIESANPDDTIAVSEQTQQERDAVLPSQDTTPLDVAAPVGGNQATTPTPDTELGNIMEDHDDSFGDLEEAFELSDGALAEYAIKLEEIKIAVEKKNGEYRAINDTRGTTITQTIIERIDELLDAIADPNNDNVKNTIEDDIEELEKLLEVLNR